MYFGEAWAGRDEGFDHEQRAAAQREHHRSPRPFGDARDDQCRRHDRAGARRERRWQHDRRGAGHRGGMAGDAVECRQQHVRRVGREPLDGRDGNDEGEEEYRLEHRHHGVGEEIRQRTERGDAPERPGDERRGDDGGDDTDDESARDRPWHAAPPVRHDA